MRPVHILIAAAVILVLGIIIFPVLNRCQFRNLPPEQQVRILMKEAKGLVYFKNVAKGGKGTLFYVKNRRKILAFPWVLVDGKMICTRKNPFEKWDYPEEQELLNDDELAQVKQELENFNKKNPVKIVFHTAE